MEKTKNSGLSMNLLSENKRIELILAMQANC